MAYLACSIAIGPVSQIMAAMRRHSSISASGGTTRFTSPICSASADSTRRPVKINSLALPRPIRRGRRWVPPAPGMMARRVSVRPRVAAVEAMRMSQASASSVPPPSAMPFTAAMTGMPSCSMAVKRLRMVKMNSFTFSGGSPARSFRSAPEQKAFSPEPVITMTRTSRRCRTWST